MSEKKERSQKACEYCLHETTSCAFSMEQKKNVEKFPLDESVQDGREYFSTVSGNTVIPFY